MHVVCQLLLLCCDKLCECFLYVVYYVILEIIRYCVLMDTSSDNCIFDRRYDDDIYDDYDACFGTFLS